MELGVLLSPFMTSAKRRVVQATGTALIGIRVLYQRCELFSYQDKNENKSSLWSKFGSGQLMSIFMIE